MIRNWSGHGHVQGGTHEEMPCPAISVVDGAARFLTEARVGFCMVEVQVVVSKIIELVLSEAQLPGDVAPMDGKGVVMFWDKGHGIVVK